QFSESQRAVLGIVGPQPGSVPRLLSPRLGVAAHSAAIPARAFCHSPRQGFAPKDFVSSSALFVALQTGLSTASDSSGSCISSPAIAVHNPARSQHPVSVRPGKPSLTSLMHPFQWCNGCFCGLGLVSTNKSCSMPPISFQDLPLNIYMVIFGTGIFVFMLSLIFCCYFISKLRNQAQSERYGYKEVVLKGDAKKLQLYGQTCAVCLEDFKGKDELGVLPCQHAFHRKCLVKWLEVRCVCPMCNKPIAGPTETTQSIGILLDELV
ncbi:RING finger protein 122, partial [Lemmus lemmus]